MGKTLLLEPKLSKQDMGEKADLTSSITKLAWDGLLDRMCEQLEQADSRDETRLHSWNPSKGHSQSWLQNNVWETFCAPFLEQMQQVSDVQSLTLAAKQSSSLPCQERSYSLCQVLSGGTICLTLHNSSRPYLHWQLALQLLLHYQIFLVFLHLKMDLHPVKSLTSLFLLFLKHQQEQWLHW